jgi:hypothetical protein
MLMRSDAPRVYTCGDFENSIASSSDRPAPVAPIFASITISSSAIGRALRIGMVDEPLHDLDAGHSSITVAITLLVVAVVAGRTRSPTAVGPVDRLDRRTIE